MAINETELNDTLATANLVAMSVAVTGRLSTSSDLDFYKVTATSVGTLSVIFDVPTNSSLDYFQLGLYNSAGTLLSLFSTGVDKTYTIGAVAAGSYYVGVGSATYYSNAQYSVTVSNTVGGAAGYEVELNNTVATATAATLGSPIVGQLATSTDIDYYKITATSAGTLSVIFDVPTNSSLDYFQLGLYNSAGTLLSLFSTGVDKTYTIGAAAAGSYYVGVSSTTYYSNAQYSVTVSNLAGGDAGYEVESNNTLATSTAATLGSPIVGQLAMSTDIDYYKITATAAGTLSVVFDVPTNSSLDYFLLGLYNSAGTLLSLFSTGVDKTYTIGVIAAGSYYVGVSSAAYYSSEPYSLTVSTSAGGDAGYEVESNNTLVTATAATLGSPIVGQLATSTDIDYYKITATSAGTLSVILDVPTNSSLDYFELGLYNSAGTFLSLFSTGIDKTYTIGAVAAGSYYVGVSSATYYSNAQYSVTVSNTAGGAAGYEVESNNTIATATAATLGSPIVGQLATSTDIDAYKITATSAGTLSVVFDVPTNSSLDYFQLGLYNSAGTLLSLFSTGVDKTYTIGAAAAGSYYVGVSSATYYSNAQYSVTVSNSAGGDAGYEVESNDTLATATAATLGSPIVGQLATSTDIDAYKITATSAGTLSVIFDVPTNSSLDYFQLGLYNSAGTLLSLFSTGGDKTYTIGAVAAGNYYVGVSSAIYYSNAQYSVTVSNTAGGAAGYEVESNNTLATATAATLGSPIVGQLVTPTDIDYYKVTATSTGTLSVIFDVPTNSSLDYFQLGLYNSAGTLLSLFSTGVDKTYTIGAIAAGSYYVGVSSATYYSNAQYSVTVSNTAGGAAGYEVESNNTVATATAATLGSPIVGQLATPTDIDFYTFSTASAGVVALSLKTPTNSLYSYFKIAVYDATGLQISTAQTGADANWNVNIHTVGKYYVTIADGTYYNSGQYSLTAAVVAGTVVTSQNQTLNSGATIKVSSLIASISDPANNAITSYSFWDEGAGGGYLSLNGVKQASASWVTVAFSDISKLVYIGGSVAGVENIDIAAYNGIAWSSYAVANVTTKASLLPALLVQSQSVNSGDAILASSLITSYSDPNQLQITSFRFWDEGAAGGYLTLNGVKQASSTWVTVTAADLSKVSYIGGATATSEYVDIELYNGHDWSDYRSAAVTTKEILPAVLTVQNQTVDINTSVKISSLISTVRDPNNYAVTSYRFWDEGSIGGYLSLNGVKQASATWVVVDSASLSSLIYVGGAVAGQESIDVEAWNGHIWSTYISALIITRTTQYVNPPVITINNQSVNVNSSIQASLLIDSVIDPSGYQITSYQFRDNGIGGGYFIFNNNQQNSREWITVSASQLDKLLYVGGAAAGTETVDVAAYDDHAWSTYKTSTLTTTVIEYLGPVVVAQNQTVNANSSIQAITLITSITDNNNFAIAAYGFWDEGVGGGYLALEGAKQVSGKWIVVSATDLHLLSYVGGGSAGVEKIDIVASNGQVWSSYASAAVTTAIVSLPEITTVNRTVAVDGHIAVQSLIGTINDPGNLPILSYAFRDEGNSGGYLSLDGVAQNSGTWIVVAADKISTLSYFSGTQTGAENIGIKAQDANGWSNYSVATVLTQGVVVVNSVVAKLSDATIKSDVTVAMADNSISYNEMLKILSDVMLAGVTAGEFNDLKTLFSYFNKVDGAAVDAYVFDISNKVINGDPANQYWTGGALSKVALGNLAAGSSQAQMDELIKKWFLGEDLPSPIFDAHTAIGYVKFTGQLYGSSGDPLVSDINQGYLGDCYLLASLAEVANCEPNVIKSMITDNGNGTYGVRFYIQGKEVYVTVNSFLPVDSSGVLLGNRSANLWSSLIEKAYVQLNEEPGYLNQTVGNIYKNIDGGSADPITKITGRSVTEYNFVNYSSANWLTLKSTIVTAIKAGLEVDFGDLMPETHNILLDGKISFAGHHMFAGIGYNDVTGNFIIRNPWGSRAGQDWTTEFEATMADLYSEHGTLFVANGSRGAMAFSTSLAATDNIPPVVTSFSPLPTEINVAADTNLVAVFSEDIQRGAGLILLKTAAGAIVASYDAATSSNLTVTGSTLTINPTADLGFGTAYSVEFAQGSIKDLAGNDYAGTTSYNFTTAAVGNAAATGNVTINGVATQGQTLTATNSLADADGLGAITYQWKADGADIGSAASTTLVLGEAQVGKVITVVGRYTDGHGTIEAVSSAASTQVVNVNDAPTGAVAITGLGTQGQTLTATNTLADADGLGAITYQWKVEGTALATGSALVLDEAQVGKTITVVGGYTDGHGTAESISSAATTPVVNVNDPGSVFINGTMVAGQTLTAVAADADGLGPVSYQWFADSVVIGGATTGSFLVSAAQVGHTVTVTAKYTDLHGTAESVSGGLGKAVDLLAYSWKAHTLLDAVDVSAAGHAASTTAGGTASLTAGAGSSLDVTAARGVPSAEAAATSQAVNLQDAIAILKMIVGLDVNGAGKALSPYQAYAADFDGNGKVELSDAIAVLKHVVGLPSPDPQWLFFNEADTTVPGKANLSPGTPPALSADMSSAGPVNVGLVGVMRGDVDGSYAGAPGAQSLDINQAGYFTALVAAHTDLSASQFGVYPS